MTISHTRLHIIEFKPSSKPAGYEVFYMNTLVGYFIEVEGHDDTYFLYDSQLHAFAVEAIQPGVITFTDDFLDDPATFSVRDFFPATANLVSAGILR